MTKALTQEIDYGGKCLVHCHAGHGRTGMIIACYLVYSLGYSAAQAVTLTRQRRAKAIQTKGQVQLVKDFEAFLSSKRTLFALTKADATLPTYVYVSVRTSCRPSAARPWSFFLRKHLSFTAPANGPARWLPFWCALASDLHGADFCSRHTLQQSMEAQVELLTDAEKARLGCRHKLVDVVLHRICELFEEDPNVFMHLTCEAARSGFVCNDPDRG